MKILMLRSKRAQQIQDKKSSSGYYFFNVNISLSLDLHLHSYRWDRCLIFHCWTFTIEILLGRISIQGVLIDISQYRLFFGFSLLYTDRVPFDLLDSAAFL
jgi:hypothetical protein